MGSLGLGGLGFRIQGLGVKRFRCLQFLSMGFLGFSGFDVGGGTIGLVGLMVKALPIVSIVVLFWLTSFMVRLL